MSALKRYLLLLFRFSPRARTAMVITLDLALCAFAALFAYSLRVGEWRVFTPVALALVVMTCAMWLAVAPFQGVYRSMLRFSGAWAIRDLATSCAIIALLMTVLVVILEVGDGVPRTLSLLVPLMLFLVLASSRIILSALLRDTLYSQRRDGGRDVLIYGAGVTGRELSVSIKNHPEFHVVGFVDDNPLLRGRRLEEHRIWHAAELEDVLARNPVDEVLLAIPGASRSRRRAIIDEVRAIAPGVGVRSLPDLAEIASGRVSVNDLRQVRIEELLGRDQVAPDPRLMSAKITGQSVMVTGAGGSIGSELTRQIVLQSPSRIILAERSEYALYLIDSELRELCERHRLDVEIEPRLVDVADPRDLERVFSQYSPDTVFHAAAYKHVTLVETDPLAGIRNNVRGSYNCCMLAEQFGVKDFTLVSTDKAVRPSSVMGASKRVCEMIVQSRAAAQDGTRYSAVRFGNVLGSSGSVVPLFRRQIAAGGPVTITDRQATRYFMTISEAAQLVVQAGAMAEGGEIFLLDMGEPVAIYDLAKMMIQLSGLAVVAETGDDGDIEIVEIGLRPGEKLHEELLIGESFPTSHPRIMKATETAKAGAQFSSRFAELMTALDRRDADAALAAMDQLISTERRPARTALATAAKSPTPSKSQVRRRTSREPRIVSTKQAFES